MHSYLEHEQGDATSSLGMADEGGPNQQFRASTLVTGHTFFDLPALIRALKAPGQSVASKTLLKADDLRIVLTVLKKGAKMSEHHADARISLQVLSGSVRFQAGEHFQELRAGSLVTLEPSIPHAIEGLESSTLLTTLAWPPGSTLLSIPHRGYS